MPNKKIKVDDDWNKRINKAIADASKKKAPKKKVKR